ncbi:CvfB family protein [Inconstantimicrobium mannanitabidum]|uniref:DNA-binding protein n=1 Tax=Inconstantimicrobium mannanitabidum TaxID=1604901 RepID=A0ACB5R959_9CLOT|nr:S1-like domain-containing RNA-binding protein [Clostridium sp. TW13]GKX65722.1 DNA-binding protein [Clostridium sp. TW13]
MIKIGEINKLEIIKITAFGYYLREEGGVEEILLPNSSVKGDIAVGDTLDFFVYKDSEDRPIATMKTPLAKVGDIASLKVVSKTRIGAFVDIGLEKDILVPLKETEFPLEENEYYFFYVYLDKTERIAATPRIDKKLEYVSPYNPGDDVTALVYDFSEAESALVAVDNKYRGLILKNEYFVNLKKGDEVKGKVKKIYEDGTLSITLRTATHRDERLSLEDTILEYLKSHNGVMPYCDKSSPDDIRKQFNTSKNYFKNALGGLMKKKLIKQDENGTTLL